MLEMCKGFYLKIVKSRSLGGPWQTIEGFKDPQPGKSWEPLVENFFKRYMKVKEQKVTVLVR